MAKKRKGFGDLVREGFEEKIKVRINGKKRRVPALEIIAYQQVMQAVKGERQALRFVLKNLAEIRRNMGDRVRLEYWNSDGSKVIYCEDGRVKCVDPDRNVVGYKSREEYDLARTNRS